MVPGNEKSTACNFSGRPDVLWKKNGPNSSGMKQRLFDKLLIVNYLFYGAFRRLPDNPRQARYRGTASKPNPLSLIPDIPVA